jgi:hypothetical protein
MFSSFWTRSTHHLPNCPWRSSSEIVDTLGAKYVFCARTLGYSLAVTMSVTRGTGGFPISPHLQFRAVVSVKSPAFSLFSSCLAEEILTTDIPDHIEMMLKELHNLFRDGKAAPTDVLANGETLLHVGSLSSMLIARRHAHTFQ